MESVNEWVVDIENKVEKMEDESKESELKKKSCIYKIPDYIPDLDAYEPQMVSLGPYHRDYKVDKMKRHKERALLHFLKRSGKKLTEYCNALEKEVKNLKEAFEHPHRLLEDDGAFVQMMILDGCFILEILRTVDGNAPDDSIFSGNRSYLIEMPTISRDMLLLSNQVPLRVLEILVCVGHGEDKQADVKHVVINSILRFFDLARRSESKDEQGGLHVLDVCRRGLLVEPPKNKTHNKITSLVTRCGHSPCCGSLRSVLGLGIQKPLESECEIDFIPPATELHQAGIQFLPSKTTSRKGITFNGSTLHVQPIVAVTDTKSFFLNLMAFERMNVGSGNEVTSYIYFMGCLIKSAKDASLLRSVGIVPGALGSDEDVAELFRSISKYAMLNPKYSELVREFRSVNKRLRNRVRMKLSAWKMDLLRNYLKSPWGGLSVIAAIVLFIFTTIQTAVTVLKYKNPK